MESNVNVGRRQPWNKGKSVGQKAPFKLKEIWAFRFRLQMESRVRELVLFNLGIDSKLRGCDQPRWHLPIAARHRFGILSLWALCSGSPDPSPSLQRDYSRGIPHRS